MFRPVSLRIYLGHYSFIFGLLMACVVPTACRRAPQAATRAVVAASPPLSTEATLSVSPRQLVLNQPPEPQSSSLASLAGALYSLSGKGPIPGTTFFLTSATGEEGADPPSVFTGASTGDIVGTSGPNGEFAFDAVPPGRYYLAVWAPYDWILAVQSETDNTPRLIEVKAGERLDLGRVDVPWP